MNKKKPLIQELEILRSFAFMAVVVQHVLGFYWNNSIDSKMDSYLVGLSFGLVKFAVPMFVFLTGFVLFYHYYPTVKYGEFLTRRSVSVILPYVLVSFFYYISTGYASAIPFELSFEDFYNHLIYGSAKYHLWYVSMIVQFFIILPLLFLLFRLLQTKIKSRKGFILVIILAVLMYMVYMTYYLKWIQVLPKGDSYDYLYHLYGNGFLSYSIYFYLGGIAALYYDEWTYLLNRFKGLIVLITLVAYVYIEHYGLTKSNGYVNLNLYGSVNIRFFVFTVLMIMTLYILALMLIEIKSINKVASIVGRNSYWAYLVHAYVLQIIYLRIVKVPMNVVLLYVIVFILGTALSVGAGAVLTKTYGLLTQSRHQHKS